jgi:hypothetical protein
MRFAAGLKGRRRKSKSQTPEVKVAETPEVEI